MQNKINPFDTIRTTQDIPAKAIVSGDAPGTEAIDIVLPIGSILLSNTHNYIEVDEFSFVPQDSKQLDAIKNLYIQRPMQKTRILSYQIKMKDLHDSYQPLVTFDYKSLEPNSIAHICLMAYLFLDNKIQELSTTKLLCFVTDVKHIEEIKTKFDNALITHKEALESIVANIKEQIKLREH